MFKVDFTVKMQKWIKDPNLRFKAGLELSGLQFQQRVARANYPPAPPMSTYIRTGTLADKAGFRIYEAGTSLTMYFGSTFYLPYLLYGTPKWEGWTPYQKKEEIIEYMAEGFKKGIQDYKE